MHPKQLITNAISHIYRNGMTTTSGGNISIIDENEIIWITPSGIDKGSLTEKDIISIDKNGTIYGPHKPSSEFSFHKAIYKARPDIKAIIHAHPPALVSFSIIRQVPNTNIMSSVKKVCGPVGYAPYGLPGSDELGDKIAAEFAGNDHLSVIMENHGIVVGGKDMPDVLSRLETLEHAAQVNINAKRIGEPNFLSDNLIHNIENQIPYISAGYHAFPDNENECHIRQEICKIIHRACEHRLMSGKSGIVSQRTENNNFIITPSDFIRWDIKPDELVKIIDGKSEKGKIPDENIRLHQEIYLAHPHVNSIIIAQPDNMMAFGITQTSFDVRTIPESWIFLQDIPRISFEQHLNNKKCIVGMLGRNVPAVLISNDSILLTGDKLIQTFDKLEIAEFSAKSLIMATSIGSFVPMGSDAIEALREKFLK